MEVDSNDTLTVRDQQRIFVQQLMLHPRNTNSEGKAQYK
jgi:hypothetical protein